MNTSAPPLPGVCAATRAASALPVLLLVDDDQLIVDTLSIVLGRDFDVVSAGTRLAAIDRLRELVYTFVELRGHPFECVLQQALSGAALLNELFQHHGLELAELAGHGFARFRQPFGLGHLQG